MFSPKLIMRKKVLRSRFDAGVFQTEELLVMPIGYKIDK